MAQAPAAGRGRVGGLAALSEAELAILRRCAAAVCVFCGAPPESYAPAVRVGEAWVHTTRRKGDVAERWCDASAIWDEFAGPDETTAPTKKGNGE